MRKRSLIFLIILLVSNFAMLQIPIAKGTDGDAWLTGWAYRKSHEIVNSRGAGSNYTIKITVINGSDSDSGEIVYLDNIMQHTFGDLRFTDNDGDTELSFWMEEVNAGINATFWVRIADDLSFTNVTFYTYYGNSSVTTTSDGESTFSRAHFGSVWKRQGIVLATGGGVDGWEEPTVIYKGDPQILTNETSVFKMWVQGYENDPQANVYYFESTDGEAWTGHSSNPILNTTEPLSGPFVMKNNGTYYLYVHGGADWWEDVDRWNSSDGVSWVKDYDETLAPGVDGEWDDEKIGNYFVWVEGSTWFMIYEAKREYSVWKLGLANSTDGKVWVREPSNPVYYRAGSCGNPFVEKIGSTYYMWYHGWANAGSGLPTDIGRALSTDLITWVGYGNPTLTRSTYEEGVGQREGQLADPHLLHVNGSTYMYYTTVRLQFDRYGISLVKTGLNFTEIVATGENPPPMVFYFIAQEWVEDWNQKRAARARGVLIVVILIGLILMGLGAKARKIVQYGRDIFGFAARIRSIIERKNMWELKDSFWDTIGSLRLKIKPMDMRPIERRIFLLSDIACVLIIFIELFWIWYLHYSGMPFLKLGWYFLGLIISLLLTALWLFPVSTKP